MTTGTPRLGPCQYRFRDGSSISLHAGQPDQPIILYYGRDNMKAGDPLSRAILAGLHDLGWRIAEFDPAEQVMRRALDPGQVLAKLPVWRRRLRKILRLAGHPGVWLRFAWYSWDWKLRRGAGPASALLRCVKTSGLDPQVMLGFSAGARWSTMSAEALGLKALICLCYPFKHPDHGDEPARYRHLASLQTPCLILQGSKDTYGGAEAAGRYALSEAVRFCFVEADHDMRLSENEQRAAVAAAVDFLRAQGLPGGPNYRDVA